MTNFVNLVLPGLVIPRVRPASCLLETNTALIRKRLVTPDLGVTIKAGTKFRIDLKQARCKFYRSFNALYSKIPKANESIIVSLIKSFCVPTLLYSLDALVLNATLLNNIDEPMYNAIGTVFKTLDRRTIRWCMFYMNVLPLRYDYVCRRTKFLLKMQTTEISDKPNY